MLIIKIQNDGTGNVKVGNYRYTVMVNNDTIDCGYIIGHKRTNGWRTLVRMLLNRSEKSERQVWDDVFDGVSEAIMENKKNKIKVWRVE
jgi:hypothetical protein